MKCAVIFGGTGFIGSFFSKYLLDNKIVDKVYLFDHETIDSKASEYRKRLIRNKNNLIYVEGDVRNKINNFSPDEDVYIIGNFAAVHREPGHVDSEYFETNIPGAENICDFAEKVDCKNLIFTSSISPYESNESVKDEFSIPVPNSAYGGSKLAAEKIHLIWQAKDSNKRTLTIVRPGVVFGPGEGGNVSRLIKAVLNRYFLYMGNKNTRKAGVYVKELCNAMYWVFSNQINDKEGVALFNMSMNPGPSIQDYVNSVCHVANIKRIIPSVPYAFLYYFSYIINFFSKPFKINHPFSPVRIKKLVRSNNIRPTFLIERDYVYLYDLNSAFKDWKTECPEEW